MHKIVTDINTHKIVTDINTMYNAAVHVSETRFNNDLKNIHTNLLSCHASDG